MDTDLIIDVNEHAILTSINNTKWRCVEFCSRTLITLVQKIGISEMLARVLLSQNITLEKAQNFLAPKIKSTMPDPFHLLDMEAAVNRIAIAIKQKQKITIFGDYDVDGATSSALFKRYFNAIGIDCDIYIPDRIKEGYGPNINALKHIKNNGTNLVITVDCGTLAVEILEKASKDGLDIIVIDHHLGGIKLPNICAVVNPNRLDDNSEYKYLAAVGVSFLVIAATNSFLRQNIPGIKLPNLLSFLDLVALGTVCDVVPLVGLNRSFVAQGLRIMSKWNKPGLLALAEITNIEDNTLNTYHLGFVIGPRINAGGRIGNSSLGSSLLTSDNYQWCIDAAKELNTLNEKRRNTEEQVTKEAISAYENLVNQDGIIILSGHNWHEGVIGITASRLKEKYGKPVIIISLNGDKGKASCRSIKGFDIGSNIVNARNIGILIAGGGHAMAAGFSIESNKISELKAFLDQQFLKVQKIVELHGIRSYVASIPIEAINIELAKEINKTAPFGAANSEPKFLIEQIVIYNIDVVGENHLRLIIGSNQASSNKNITAMLFRANNQTIEYLMQNKNNLKLIGYIRINSWRRQNNVNFIIEDIIY